jgi:hypothetical protein
MMNERMNKWMDGWIGLGGWMDVWIIPRRWAWIMAGWIRAGWVHGWFMMDELIDG